MNHDSNVTFKLYGKHIVQSFRIDGRVHTLVFVFDIQIEFSNSRSLICSVEPQNNEIYNYIKW